MCSVRGHGLAETLDRAQWQDGEPDDIHYDLGRLCPKLAGCPLKRAGRAVHSAFILSRHSPYRLRSRNGEAWLHWTHTMSSAHDSEFARAARRVRADLGARERARLLRGAATSSGLGLVAGGLVSAIGIGARDHVVAVVFAITLMATGAASVVRAARARRISIGESISTDLLIVGAGLLAGAAGEFLHALISVLEANMFHLVLAAGLGISGAVLLTTRAAAEPNGHLQAVRALRIGGAGLLLATFARSLLYVWDDVHGSPGSVAMLWLAASGAVLLRAVRSSPPGVWTRL